MIVTVEERPSIATITLKGIKEFSEEDLKSGLKQTGLAEGRVLDRALLDKAEQELQRQYFNRGKYAVEIKSTLTPLERNRVAVQFDVVEGDSAKIQQINIVGNQAFKEKTLLKEFGSTTPGWLRVACSTAPCWTRPSRNCNGNTSTEATMRWKSSPR